jgi:hypothetical protein
MIIIETPNILTGEISHQIGGVGEKISFTISQIPNTQNSEITFSTDLDFKTAFSLVAELLRDPAIGKIYSRGLYYQNELISNKIN